MEFQTLRPSIFPGLWDHAKHIRAEGLEFMFLVRSNNMVTTAHNGQNGVSDKSQQGPSLEMKHH